MEDDILVDDLEASVSSASAEKAAVVEENLVVVLDIEFARTAVISDSDIFLGCATVSEPSASAAALKAFCKYFNFRLCESFSD